MEQFFQIVAVVLLASVGGLLLTKGGREIGLLLSVGVCCLAAAAAAAYLQPVIDFLKQLEEIGNLDHRYLQILLKCVGIGFLAEVSALICKDAGNETLGKTLGILSAAVILWISLPVLSGFMMLIQKIIGVL